MYGLPTIHRLNAALARTHKKNLTFTTQSTLSRSDFESSNIESFAYDRVTKNLYIEFKTGSTYVYQDVPEQIVIDFDLAESKGKFFSENVKSEYEWVKLEQ